MTDAPAPRSQQPDEWLRHARSDLALAQTPPPPGVLLQLLCFHAQQAAEKAIKAVILHLTQSEPAFSHSLRRLLRDAEQAGAPPSPLAAEAAALLTQYAVLTRYPDDIEDIDEAEWQQAVADARAVVEWAGGVVGTAPDAP